LNQTGRLISRPLRFSVTTSGTTTSTGTIETAAFLTDFLDGFAFAGALFVFGTVGAVFLALGTTAFVFFKGAFLEVGFVAWRSLAN
jgi:hypothetical protein